jgi:hypothetical protein
MQLVVSQGWDWEGPDGGQIKVKVCPFCKKGDSKFYMAVMNPEEGTRDGLYFCHHGSCGKTGNLRTLQEHLGLRVAGVESRSEWAGKSDRKADDLPNIDVCHAALLGDASALDYLLNVRGFSEAIIKQQKLGLKEKVYFRQAGEVRALVIPYLVNGNAVFVKYRTLPPSPKDFVCPAGWEAPLYNGETLQEGMNEIVFVEGEADAIACMSVGIKNVVGVPGANVKKAAWIETLDKVAPEKIYILYDSDRAGQKGAQEIASRIGIDKCLRLVLPAFEVEVDGVKRPGKDVNEWFSKGGGTLEAFERLKEDAEFFDVTGVTSAGDALTQLEDELSGKVDLAPKYITQWASLNKLVGFEDGDVIDILAPEKVGKTTFGMNLMDHMASAYGEDGLIVCLEMTQARLARKWVAMVTGFEDFITQPGTPESKAQLEKLKAACVQARQLQQNRNADLYFAYPQMVKQPEDVFKLIRDCIRRYGVKWVMFDNLQLLCDNTLENKGHRTIHLSQISKGFAKLAKDHKIKLIRILQPRQIEDGHMVTARHTDGSSQIAKDCDAHITLWRSSTGEIKKSEWEKDNGAESDESFEPKMKVTVALSRYSSGGSRNLWFDGARSQVTEMPTSVAPKQQFNSIIATDTVPTESSAPTAHVPSEAPITI